MKVTFVCPRFEKFVESLPELDAGMVNYFLGDFNTPPSREILHEIRKTVLAQERPVTTWLTMLTQQLVQEWPVNLWQRYQALK